LSDGFELKSSPAWRKKRQAAVPVQAAQQDDVGFSQFPGKAFQHKRQLPVEYFSVCVVDLAPYMENNSANGRYVLKTFPRPQQREWSWR
jgi:hypothetical protein